MNKAYINYFLFFKCNSITAVIIVLCVLVNSNVKSQDNNAYFNKVETDIPNSLGIINHTACKAIIFQPGYRFKAKEGKTMHAYIDPALVCNVDYAKTSDGGSGFSDFSTANEVGTTIGEFGVSQTGGATYNIPIIVPPGTMGMVPHLSISYNSQAGDGLLGIGWNLSGLSAISRTTQTLYHNGKIAPVNLDNNDPFTLDGNRLIVTSSSDAGIEYRTEMER